MKPLPTFLRCVPLLVTGAALALMAISRPALAYTDAGPPPPVATAPTSTTDTETPLARLQRAYELFEAQEYRAADVVLAGIMAEHDFEDSTDRFKFATYSLAASTAMIVDDPDRGWSMLAKANASPFADAELAEATLELAIEQWRPEQAIVPIRLLAAKAPEKVRALNTRTVYHINAALSRADHPQAERMEFLQALFDAGLRVEDGRQPSSLWRELAELQLAQGNTEAAIQAARRITAPEPLLALLVDRRFDAIVAALGPAQFDLDAALALETETVRAAIAREPRNLQHVVELTYLLLDAGRYQELLDTCDLALSKSGAKHPAYDDAADALNWIHDNRARALLALGRSDEAASVLEAARRMDEDGSSNVSQAINLARLYAALGKPQQALATLAGVEQASPYGWMQYHGARAYALAGTPDDSRARESLAYLREHREDAPDTFLDLMILIGADDEASLAYRKRLADPDDRNSALLSAQGYIYTPIAPISARRIARSNEFFTRPEIVEAIEATGRIRQVPMHQLVW